jgi:hypothetical protein
VPGVDGVARCQQPLDERAEQLLELGPAAVLVDACELLRLGQAKHRHRLQGEALFGPQAGAAAERERLEIVDQAIELVGERARVAGIEQQQLEQSLELRLGAVAEAVGDDALGSGEHRLKDDRVGRLVARLDDRRLQQREQLDASLEPSSGIQEAPAQISHHALDTESAERQQTLDDLLKRRLALQLRLVERHPEVPHDPLERADHEPCVAAELVAHGVGVVEQGPDRIGQRGLAAADPMQRAHQLVQRSAAGRVGAASELVGAVDDGAHQPRQRLGAFGVATQPPEVLRGPRGDRGHRVDALDRRA